MVAHRSQRHHNWEKERGEQRWKPLRHSIILFFFIGISITASYPPVFNWLVPTYTSKQQGLWSTAQVTQRKQCSWSGPTGASGTNLSANTPVAGWPGFAKPFPLKESHIEPTQPNIHAKLKPMGPVPKNPMAFFFYKKRLQKSSSWEVTHFEGDLLATPHLVSFLASMQLAKIGRSQFRHKRVKEEHCDSKKQDLQSCVKRFDFCSPEIHISSTWKGQTWHLQKLLESPEKKNQLLTHMCGATLLAVHATHHVGAVFDGLKKWKSWPTVKQSELVGQLRAWVVWKVPCLPVIPWQMTLVSLLIHTWRCLEKTARMLAVLNFFWKFPRVLKKKRCNLHEFTFRILSLLALQPSAHHLSGPRLGSRGVAHGARQLPGEQNRVFFICPLAPMWYLEY